MSKLKDYYRLFDMFKGKLTEAQKENTWIQRLNYDPETEEKCKLTLVVDYDPEGGITVKTTRGEVVVKEHTAKKYEIPATRKVVTVAEGDEKLSVKRSPATGLCIWLPDGNFIQAKRANLTMAEAIEQANPSEVAKLKIPHDGDYLVSKAKHPKYGGEQQHLSGGYLLNTHSSTLTKKKQLDKISEALHLGWRVEIIK